MGRASVAEGENSPTIPTLHEIAAMPFPASQNAMRQFYNPHWGKPVPDGTDGKRTFKVAVVYSYREESTEYFDVEAYSEDEAADLAREEFFEEYDRYENEIDSIDAQEVMEQ